jgi:eukaryotic-like serine/threonine-protein kinase
MTLEPGQIVDGKYRIVRVLGSGGMGAVYEGENARIHRKVAIKVLHAGVAAKVDVVERFEREAQAAGRIGSEHIVEVLDLGSLPSGERYMVMEFLEGESLGDRIKKRKRLEPRELAPIAHQLLEGLAAAHDAKIIHRDLKPDNVFLLTSKGGQRDFVKVLDFGVSKFSALESDSLSMTKTGAVMGTPYYMSPEQARGAKIDPRSDLYSVGVVLYQAVTGRVPFNAETFNELVFKIALESPHPAELVTPGLDPAFATIVAKAMMRDAAVRFQSAREFQQALGHWIRTGGAPTANPYEVRGSGGTMALPQMPMPMLGAQPPAQPQGFGGQQPGYPAAPQGMGPMGFGGNTPQQGMAQAGFGGNTPQQGMQSQALGGSGNQFASPGMVQSSPQLGASHAGLAMTAPQPRSNGMMIAIGLVGTLLVAAGGFGAYKVLGARASAARPTVEVQSPPPVDPIPTPPVPTPSETAATPPTAPTPSATDAPTSSGTPSDPLAPSTGKPVAVVPGPRTTGRTPGPGTGGNKKTPTTPTATTTPTAKGTATSKGPGRVIGGEL